MTEVGEDDLIMGVDLQDIVSAIYLLDLRYKMSDKRSQGPNFKEWLMKDVYLIVYEMGAKITMTVYLVESGEILLTNHK
jgi:hypothetical protein